MLSIILSSLIVWIVARIFFGPKANRLWISFEEDTKPSRGLDQILKPKPSVTLHTGQAFWLTVVVLILLAIGG